MSLPEHWPVILLQLETIFLSTNLCSKTQDHFGLSWNITVAITSKLNKFRFVIFQISESVLPQATSVSFFETRLFLKGTFEEPLTLVEDVKKLKDGPTGKERYLDFST